MTWTVYGAVGGLEKFKEWAEYMELGYDTKIMIFIPIGR